MEDCFIFDKTGTVGRMFVVTAGEMVSSGIICEFSLCFRKDTSLALLLNLVAGLLYCSALPIALIGKGPAAGLPRH